MRVSGRLNDVRTSIDGNLYMTFQIDDRQKALEEVEHIRDKDLTIQVTRYRKSRSHDANAYFWQLVDKMSKKLLSDKWTIYLLQLSKYGVFNDVIVKEEALTILEEHFRYTETLSRPDENGMVVCRCYFGSSSYNTKEMSDLIEGTVEDAKALGIDTLTPDELKAIIASWKGGHHDY